MNRKVKVKNKTPVQAVILAAGASARTKSYEPRCLLKYGGQTLLDIQIEAIKNYVPKPHISIVGGIEKYKLLKKIDRKIHFIENKNHADTNSGESLRLGFNHSQFNRFLIVHGDLILDKEMFKGLNFEESFILVDSSGKIGEKEIGLTAVNNKLSIFCYNLPLKWCQIAFLAPKEVKILEKLFWKDQLDTNHLLSFEIINKIVENGGEFKCVNIKNKFIREVDSLKDINP